MKKQIAFIIFFFFTLSCIAQKDSIIRKKDRKRDVLLQTNNGDIVVRLSDSTPLHRDNFLKLVKSQGDSMISSCTLLNYGLHALRIIFIAAVGTITYSCCNSGNTITELTITGFPGSITE